MVWELYQSYLFVGMGHIPPKLRNRPPSASNSALPTYSFVDISRAVTPWTFKKRPFCICSQTSGRCFYYVLAVSEAIPRKWTIRYPPIIVHYTAQEDKH